MACRCEGHCFVFPEDLAEDLLFCPEGHDVVFALRAMKNDFALRAMRRADPPLPSEGQGLRIVVEVLVSREGLR